MTKVGTGATIVYSVPNYTSTALAGSYTLFSADGESSLLDLSSIQSINAGFGIPSNGKGVQRIAATNQGRIDLSGVQSITGPVDSGERLDIVVAAGGVVDLSRLRSAQRNVYFDVQTDGQLKLGNLAVTNDLSITLSDVTSRLGGCKPWLLNSHQNQVAACLDGCPTPSTNVHRALRRTPLRSSGEAENPRLSLLFANVR